MLVRHGAGSATVPQMSFRNGIGRRRAWKGTLEKPLVAALPKAAARRPRRERFDYRRRSAAMLASLRAVGRLLAFAAGGLAVIIVGSFMMRGIMRLWDREKGGD